MKTLPLFLMLITSTGAWAQGVPEPKASSATTSTSEAQAQARFEHAAMGVLGGWAVGNMATGGMAWATSPDARQRGVGQGNLAWNTVNLGIAGLGLVGAARQDWSATPPGELLRRQKRMRTAFLVNGGIDLAYVGGGVALSQWAKGRNDDLRQGWGEALVLQGAFLFAFDLTAAYVQNRVIRRAKRRR